MIHVLSLLGKAGAGKTTIANHLRDRYGARVVSLAAPLKRIAKVVMDFDDAQLYGTQEDKERIDPRYGFSARRFLQMLGTEGIRANLGGLVWCEALAFNIAEEHRKTGATVFVVDDVRFLNEIDFIQDLKFRSRQGEPKMFGTVVKLMCTDAPPAGNAAHASEAEIDLVKADKIDGIVISSRAAGMQHLIDGFEALLDRAHLRNVRVALRDQARDVAEKAFQARRDAERAAAADLAKAVLVRAEVA